MAFCAQIRSFRDELGQFGKVKRLCGIASGTTEASFRNTAAEDRKVAIKTEGPRGGGFPRAHPFAVLARRGELHRSLKQREEECI